MTDPVSLPYCPDCGWRHPSYDISEGMSAWGFSRPVYASGPVDWRYYPGFRCGCRIVHEAREKGLIDEACGGHGAGEWTPARTMAARLDRAAMEISAEIEKGLWYDWSPGALKSAREEMAILDAKVEANRKLHEGRQW